METRLQLVAILASILLLVVLLELVRRRRLMERYALLWLLSAVVLLVLASWPGALLHLSRAIGIYSPPNALFGVGLAFVLALLLHFSLTVSRLTDQSKVLAQRLALLEDRVRHHDAESAVHEDPDLAADRAPQAQEHEPVGSAAGFGGSRT